MIRSLRLLEAILLARCCIAASLPPLSNTVRDRPQLCTPEPIRLKEIISSHGLNSRKLGKKGSKCQELRTTTQNTQKVCLFFGIHVRIGQHLDGKSWVQNRAESGAPSINRSPCFSATPGCGTVVCIRNAASVQPVVFSCFCGCFCSLRLSPCHTNSDGFKPKCVVLGWTGSAFKHSRMASETDAKISIIMWHLITSNRCGFQIIDSGESIKRPMHPTGR